MNDTTVVGIFKNTSDAEKTIIDLRDIGVNDQDISYAYGAEDKVIVEDVSENKAGEGAADGASAGAIIGGLAGLAVANGILPGLGTLFVAGPLATALGLTGIAATTAAGAITGAAAGTLVGALVEMGIGRNEARIYETRVKSGSVLLAAKHDNPESVKEIYKKYDVDEIREFEVIS